MPVPVTYPGVYIEEIPSGVRTITGVATSITAFIGRAARGPSDQAVTINGFADFEITTRSRHRRRDAVGQDRHDGNIHFRPDEYHRHDDRVIDRQFVGIGEVDATVEGAFHDRVGNF